MKNNVFRAEGDCGHMGDNMTAVDAIKLASRTLLTDNVPPDGCFRKKRINMTHGLGMLPPGGRLILAALALATHLFAGQSLVLTANLAPVQLNAQP